MKGWLKAEISRTPVLYAALLVAICACAAYANSLQNGFHYDDLHHIVANPYLRDLKFAPQYFSRPDMFSALPGHNMYRPMVLLSFALDYSWGGYDPLAWRLTAIALHALCSVGVLLTFRLLARRSSERPDQPGMLGALVAALFFALHPVFTETVNYAAARSSLLATCALLWAVWAHQRAVHGRPGAGRILLWCLSLLLFAAGLLSKEIAIVFPVLLIWMTVVSRRRDFLALLPALLVAAVYLYVRQELLGTAVIDFGARARALALSEAGTGGARPILWNLLTQARVISAYLLLILLPGGLCVDRYVRVSQTPWEWGVLGGVLVIAALLWIAWRVRHRRPLVSLGLVWFLVALGPTSSLIPLNQVMNEHRLYLPGIGLALALGAVVVPHVRRWVPLLAVVLLALTLQRNLDWRDSLRLWQSAVEVSPESDGAWNSLGVQLRNRGRRGEAEHAFAAALELNPDSWDACFNMGTLYLARGRESGRDRELQQAQHWLERSLAVRPEAERSRWFLAEVLYAMGRREKAEQAFRALAGLRPRRFEMTRFPLARIALDRRDFDGAERLYGEALSRGIDPVSAQIGLARVALRRGDERGAVAAARRASRARPQSFVPYLFLARMHKGTARAAHDLFEAERRGYRPTAAERRSILAEKRS